LHDSKENEQFKWVPSRRDAKSYIKGVTGRLQGQYCRERGPVQNV
jgi:hypothetical protein